MFNSKTDGQTIGGSADLLTRMSKERLVKLWYDTDKKLKDIDPMEDYESYVFYRTLFDNIVMTYYSNYNGFTKE